MSTLEEIYAKIDELRIGLDDLEELVGDYDPNVEPPPPPDESAIFDVTAERANARFAWKQNQAGRPIMQIYPADNAPVKQRVQFTRGAMVEVMPKPIKADGGDQYYEIAEEVIKDGDPVQVTLYLRSVDGKVQE